MARPDIIGLGEAMVLLQPPAGTLLLDASAVEIHVAGAEFNVCAAAARLGATAGFCSRVGTGPLGARVLAQAGALGVDTTLVTIDPARPTGLFLRDARIDGQRRVYYYRHGSAASALSPDDAGRLVAARPRVVMVSGVTLALGAGPRATVEAVLRQARPAGITVALDPNLRPALGPVNEQADHLRALLPYVDYLLLGTDEAAAVLGVGDPTDPIEVFAAARRAGVGETVLKAGAGGCFHASIGGGVAHLPSAATTVVDPVGAGDAFAGGYLIGRARGATPAGAAWLGTALAAGVVGASGDTTGLPDPLAAAGLLATALLHR